MKCRAEGAGRPTAVRFSAAERAIVKQASAANSASVSDFIRDAVLLAAADSLEGVVRRSPGGRVVVFQPSTEPQP